MPDLALGFLWPDFYCLISDGCVEWLHGYWMNFLVGEQHLATDRPGIAISGVLVLFVISSKFHVYILRNYSESSLFVHYAQISFIETLPSQWRSKLGMMFAMSTSQVETLKMCFYFVSSSVALVCYPSCYHLSPDYHTAEYPPRLLRKCVSERMLMSDLEKFAVCDYVRTVMLMS